MAGPIGCVVAVTYRCNARCGMCDIWRQKADVERELSPSDYEWLPASLRSVNLSGGEPFMRDDLPEVYSVVRRSCPRARVVVSTNGLSPDRIERSVAAMRGIAVRVSIDAVGSLHDEIRGVPGAYEKALETVRRLKSLGVGDIGLAATSSGENPGQLRKVRALAEELDVRFVASAVHSSPIFFGSQGDERPASEEAAREILDLMRIDLSSRRPRDWAMAYYMRGLADYVRGKRRRLPCRAGIDFFYLDPWGSVYPCNIRGTPMGNVRDGSFLELQKRSAATVRAAVAGCEEQCWMVCTVAPPMRRRPLGPLCWIAGAKLLGRDAGG
ncbi:MAG: radical SAM protein [Candidatus Eisenbacteria bacterium]|nr:radical SAM protein [Candidatus Eisenbacteria bacterium]